MSKENETVDTEALEDILKSLKTAQDDAASALAKGGVENGGTVGSGGKQGGGQGSESDAGPIDNMMIAKMIQSGVDVQTAAAFQRFVAKMSEVDGEEDDDAKKSALSAESLVKSFRETLGESLTPEQNEMVDVTPYLDGLTSAVGGAIDEMNKSLAKSNSEHRQVALAQAKAIAQMGQLLKSQARVINVLGERLGVVEKAPAAAPKGVTGTAQPVQKSMAGEAGDGDAKLTKSQTLSVLSYKNLVKGEREFNGIRVADIVTGLEAGNVYDETLHSEVQRFFKSLTPQEREQAIKF